MVTTPGAGLLIEPTAPEWAQRYHLRLVDELAGVAANDLSNVSDWVDVRKYGAQGDLLSFTGVASITTGTPNLSVTGASFNNTAVGKTVWVQYAAGGGAPLVAKVVAVASATGLTLSANASTTVSNVDACVGTDDTVAIKAAIAALPSTGGAVWFPRGAYGWSDAAGLVLGNGSSGGASTTQNIVLIGETGGTGFVLASDVQGSMIRYIGSTTGTYALDAKGPIRIAVKNLIFDGGYYVATGFNLKHVFRSVFDNAYPVRNTSKGFKLGSYSAPTGVYLGASDNLFSYCHPASPGASPYVAWDIGETAYGGLDVSQCVWIGCSAAIGDDTTTWAGTYAATSTAIALRFCDNLRFYDCFTVIAGQRRGWGLRIIPPSGAFPAGVFPAEIQWDGPLTGGVTIDSSSNAWTPDLNSGRGLHFSVLNDGDMTDPGFVGVASLPTSSALGNHEGVSGFCSSGTVLDRFQPVQTRAGVVTYGAAVIDRKFNSQSVANTVAATSVYSFSLPAYALRVFNRTPNASAYKSDRGLRIRLRGLYFNNSGAASNFTLVCKLGTQTLLNLSAVSMAAAAGYRTVSADIDLAETNAQTNQQAAYARVDLGASSSGGTVAQLIAASYTQDQTSLAVDSTVANTLDVTVTHGTANANIIFNLDQVTVELLSCLRPTPHGCALSNRRRVRT